MAFHLLRRLNQLCEVFLHQDQPTFSYWQSKGRKNYEVDLIAEIGDRTIPFEVKYQDKQINDSDLKGLRMFMEKSDLDIGYAITRNPESLSVRQPHSTRQGHLKELISGKIICAEMLYKPEHWRE